MVGAGALKYRSHRALLKGHCKGLGFRNWGPSVEYLTSGCVWRVLTTIGRD